MPRSKKSKEEIRADVEILIQQLQNVLKLSDPKQQKIDYEKLEAQIKVVKRLLDDDPFKMMCDTGLLDLADEN